MMLKGIIVDLIEKMIARPRRGRGGIIKGLLKVTVVGLSCPLQSKHQAVAVYAASDW